jgi:serine/threonine protein kinase
MTTSDHNLASEYSTIELGQLVADKYRMVRRLGQGGMGAVYEAQHTLLKRRFAIKLLRAEFATNPEMLARFRREAQAAGRIESDHVAAVVDFGVTADGNPYIVMEYLDGADLGGVIEREGTLSLPRAVSLIEQACQGVAAAHAGSIVHRDLKPGNLFICQKPDGREQLKVLDFGVAKLGANLGDESTITNTGGVVGTPCYMSPEQARGDQRIDHRTDIYSLGAVLYEALSGHKAHTGSSYNQIIYEIISRAPVPLAELRPDLPRALASVVECAMAKQPADRYPTASEFAQALMRASKSEPAAGLTAASAALASTEPTRGPSRVSPGNPLVAAGLAPNTRLEAVVASTVRPRRGRWVVAVMLGGSLACVALLVGRLVWTGPDAEGAPVPSWPVASTFLTRPGSRTSGVPRPPTSSVPSEGPASGGRSAASTIGSNQASARSVEDQAARDRHLETGAPRAPRATSSDLAGSGKARRRPRSLDQGRSAPVTEYDLRNPYE